MEEGKKIVPGSVVVTGATGSMGAAAVRDLASRGIPVVMACRNIGKAEILRAAISADFPSAVLQPVLLDLESLDSVRAFADAMRGTELSGLFNNAGTMCRDYGVTADGFERTMAVNYLAPSLLTRLLVPSLVRGAHVVNMVSVTTKIARLDLDWPSRKPEDFGQLRTYFSSKLALLYFTVAFARHYPSLVVNMSDPGVVNSNMISMHRWFDPLADLLFRPLIKSPEKGVAPALAALQSDCRLKYFVGNGWKEVPARFLRSPLPEQLWDQATVLLGL